MRRLLMGLLVVVSGYAYWKLDGLLHGAAWVTHYGKQMTAEDIVSGWPILLAAWPLTLVGVIVGCIPSALMIEFLHSRAEESDRGREVVRLQAKLNAHRQEVHDELAERERIVTEMAADAHERYRQAEARQQDAASKIVAANEERDRAVEAARRTRHAYERKQRQLEKARTGS